MSYYTENDIARIARTQKMIRDSLTNLPAEKALVDNFPTGFQTLPRKPRHTISPGSMISVAEQADYALPGGYTTRPPSAQGVGDMVRSMLRRGFQ